ncbi:hypothetical protein Barb7_01450 [Bacteroidales bacterium Barb7]|nr:hypothetical protein Barb7_01450 [Bacteroidales bacterium Barb7]
MVADTAFVRTNRIAVLDTVAHVHIHFSLVVHPCYAESENTVGNTQPFNQVGFLKLRMFIVHILNRFQHFGYRLQIFRLIGKSAFQIIYNFLCFHLH